MQYIKISRSVYIAARKATLLERQTIETQSTVSSHSPITTPDSQDAKPNHHNAMTYTEPEYKDVDDTKIKPKDNSENEACKSPLMTPEATV